MKYWVSILILVSILHRIVESQQWYQKNNPHFISHSNFNQLIINQQTRYKQVIFVKFFTPWCRYCRFLKEIMDKLKSQQQYNIRFLDINCDGQNYRLCSEMGVRSFPKLTVYHNGEIQQSMDGYYPYPVMKELFRKYNHNQQQNNIHNQQEYSRIKQQQQSRRKQQEQHRIKQQQQHNTRKKQQQQHNRRKNKKNNIIEEKKQQQHKKRQQQQYTRKQQQQHRNRQQQHKNRQQQHKNRQQQQQKSKQIKKQQPHKIDAVPIDNKVFPHSANQPQQMLQQSSNTITIDSNPSQAEKQKQILQKSILSSSSQHIQKITEHFTSNSKQYGKYFIYSLIIVVGLWYFKHIMAGNQQNLKEQNHNNKYKQVNTNNNHINKQYKNHNSNNSSSKHSSIDKVNKYSLEDQLRQQIEFQHPDHEENNSNQEIQIRDQDL